MQSRDAGWFLQMLLASRKVRQFTAGVDRRAFDTDEVLQNAITHLVQIVGEAATRVSEAGRVAHPEIPWQDIIGMRNRLVHDYLNIDLDYVWEIVESDVDTLISSLEGIVPSDDSVS